MNEAFAIVSLILGVAGTCLDAVWWIQLMPNFGKFSVNTPPDTMKLKMVTFTVFLIMSLYSGYVGYHY